MHEFSEHNGWRLSDDIFMDDPNVEFIFERDDCITLVMSFPNSPFVTKQHLAQAVEKQAVCSELNGGICVRVMLVYGALLMKPHNLPKNISVASIMVSNEPEYHYMEN